MIDSYIHGNESTQSGYQFAGFHIPHFQASVAIVFFQENIPVKLEFSIKQHMLRIHGNMGYVKSDFPIQEVNNEIEVGSMGLV
jgi:hypothetical protein